MGRKIKITRRGFTLVETLIGALILTIVGAGIASSYVLESSLLAQASHRLQAINYAMSCADNLMEVASDFGGYTYTYQSSYYGPDELSLGFHSQATDPAVATIPDSYFRRQLNGVLEYNVEMLPLYSGVGWGSGITRVTITVRWNEKFPKRQNKQESLVVLPIAYSYTGGTPAAGPTAP